MSSGPWSPGGSCAWAHVARAVPLGRLVPRAHVARAVPLGRLVPRAHVAGAVGLGRQGGGGAHGALLSLGVMQLLFANRRRPCSRPTHGAGAPGCADRLHAGHIVPVTSRTPSAGSLSLCPRAGSTRGGRRGPEGGERGGVEVAGPGRSPAQRRVDQRAVPAVGGGEGRWRPSRDGRAATARAQASGSRMRKGREPGADMEVGGVVLSRRSTRVGAGRATQG